jgi:endonuclease YncB( thermonuclease family)
MTDTTAPCHVVSSKRLRLGKALVWLAVALSGLSAGLPAIARRGSYSHSHNYNHSGQARSTRASDEVKTGDTFDARVSYVVDGDSIWVKPINGGRVRLRMAGIDAPEICQTSGPEARQAMLTLALDQEVHVVILAHDRYGRAIARVRRRVDGVDLSESMVDQGWAWNETFRWHRGDYPVEQRTATATHRGLFAEPTPELPADFRHRHGPCKTYRQR